MHRNDYLQALISATAAARTNYRLTGAMPNRLIYEHFYLLLGTLALNKAQTRVINPAALDAMHRLAINAP